MISNEFGLQNKELCSQYLTTLGCLNSLRSEISRIAVDGTPSSSDSSRIFFSATNFPVDFCRALYTTPRHSFVVKAKKQKIFNDIERKEQENEQPKMCQELILNL
uniref:Uncharacterized protein n=1 Tax=Romanomermis culicivorax TaxID=13658 RepID=A0A915HQS5_ROMCU